MEQQQQIIASTCLKAPLPPEVALRDQFGRTFNYLRIAINTQCNLRCIYCMPEEGIAPGPPDKTMTSKDIVRMVSIAAELGVNKVRFTGGEPLLHPHITSLVQTTFNTPGIDAVHLTTNGVLLKGMARELQEAGLKGVNISINSLDSKKYRQMTRRNTLKRAMDGLEAAFEAGIESVKINAVALRGFNDVELKSFVDLTKEYPLTIRFIELMPFDAQQIWKTGKFMGADHIKQILHEYYPDMFSVKGSETEHYVYGIPGHSGKVAIIPAFSRNLCGACNRIRVTADGKIRNCLFANHEYNILDLLRKDGTNGELKNMLLEAMWKKDVDGWEARNKGAKIRASMSLIGG